jgi:hypothetical protein
MAHTYGYSMRYKAATPFSSMTQLSLPAVQSSFWHDYPPKVSMTGEVLLSRGFSLAMPAKHNRECCKLFSCEAIKRLSSAMQCLGDAKADVFAVGVALPQG